MKHIVVEAGERTLEEILFWWPEVQRRAKGEWVAGFARSIACQARRPKWRPTSKQTEIMRQMVDDLFRHRDAQKNPDFVAKEN
jgi:hypothetical protein